MPGVNGGQQGQMILNMDGAASQDSGNLQTGYISPSIDAIGEVKLLISNYTAEYGGRPPRQFDGATEKSTPPFPPHRPRPYPPAKPHTREIFNHQNHPARPPHPPPE